MSEVGAGAASGASAGSAFGPWSAAIGGVIGGVSSLIGGSKSAKEAKKAASEANKLIASQYGQTRADLAPYRDAGTNALSLLQYSTNPLLSKSGTVEVPLTQQETYDELRKRFPAYVASWKDSKNKARGLSSENWQIMLDEYNSGKLKIPTTRTVEVGSPQELFEESPGYQFRLDEGNRAIGSSAAARGRLFSGDAIKKAAAYTQGAASQEWDNYLANLRGLSNSGQQAASATAAAGANAANNQASNIMNAGNLRASSYMTAAEGVNNALQGTISNYLLSQYLKPEKT